MLGREFRDRDSEVDEVFREFIRFVGFESWCGRQTAETDATTAGDNLNA